MKAARDAFGARLKLERERAGVSLDTIAQSTKINRSLLVDLENNDLSRWPNGIFRRAFFREYLAAINYSSDAVVSEFARLFPDSGASEESGGELRLKLAPMPSSDARRLLTQTAAALADLCLLSLIGVAAIAALPFQPWAVVAVLVAAYYGLSAALLGRAPAAAWLARDRKISRTAHPETVKAPVTEPALLRIVVRHADVLRDRTATSDDGQAVDAPAPLPSSNPARRHATSR